MVIIGLIITLLIAIVCWKKEADSSYNEVWFVGGIFSTLAVIVMGIMMFGCIFECTESKYIDDKIAMYEEENNVIEKDIETIVLQYQNHEKEVFDMSDIESPTTLVQMYPELKSDKLVTKQIDIFNANNNKIKELKLRKIECEKAKFMLYFGG